MSHAQFSGHGAQNIVQQGIPVPDILINEKPVVSIALILQDFSRTSIVQLPGIILE